MFSKNTTSFPVRKLCKVEVKIQQEKKNSPQGRGDGPVKKNFVRSVILSVNFELCCGKQGLAHLQEVLPTAATARPEKGMINWTEL
jgi:hypothetical protein